MSTRQRGNYPYPDDEFDQIARDQNLPHGVHRTRVSLMRRLLPFLIVAVLAPAAAFVLVTWFLNSGSAPKPTAENTPTVATSESVPAATTDPAAEPSATEDTSSPAPSTSETVEVDYSVAITTLNGAGVKGIAGDAKDKLVAAGFETVSATDFTGSATDPASSTVFYASEDLSATADAVAQSLGLTTTKLDAAAKYGDGISVVLRSDYKK